MKATGRTLYACTVPICCVVTFVRIGPGTPECPSCHEAGRVLVTDADRQRPTPRDLAGLAR
jgi:hypothetical protein